MPADVRRFVEGFISREVPARGSYCYVRVEPRLDGKSSAAWCADTYRVRVFPTWTGAPLEPVADALRRLPGCREIEMIRDHERIRPTVLAYFDPDSATVAAPSAAVLFLGVE